MKDRVVQHPNRYKLTPVSGDIYDLTLEPGIVTEPGTDISKATLLKDTTAALYGLGADAVPDDVFAAIPDRLDQIGDIKITVRTDLGENWLLCNGSLISPSNHPELSDMLSPFATITDTWDSRSIGITLFHPVYADGYWMACSNTKNKIYFTPDLVDVPWTEIVLDTNINRIAYGDGYWVAVGDSGTVFYAEGTPEGEWTKIVVPSPKKLEFVTYDDGCWVACGERYAYFIRGTPNGAWTSKWISSTTTDLEYFTSAAYGDGSWVFCGRGDGSIHYTTTPLESPTWVKRSFSSSYYPSTVVYYKGGWMVLGTGFNATVKGSPTNNWTFTQGGIAGRLAKVIEDYLVIVVERSIKYTTESIDGPWTSSTGLSGITSDLSQGVAFGQGVWVVPYSSTLRLSGAALPVLESHRSYVYIKAR